LKTHFTNPFLSSCGKTKRDAHGGTIELDAIFESQHWVMEKLRGTKYEPNERREPRRGEREVGQISIYVDIIYLTREIFLRLVVGGDDVHTAFQAGPSTSFFVTGDGTPLFRSPASTLIVPLCNRNMAREILYACHEAGLGRKRNLNPVLLHQCMTLLAICQAGDSTVLVTIGVSPTIRFAVCMCCLAKVHLDISILGICTIILGVP